MTGPGAICQWTLEGTMSRPALPAMPDDLRAALVTVSEKVLASKKPLTQGMCFTWQGHVYGCLS